LALQHPGGGPVRIEALASAEGIPANYLVQILIDLKAHGIVRSVRGKDGGYQLSRPPSEISMGDVLRAIHGEVFETAALRDGECPAPLRWAWQHLKDALQGAADGITFQQLVEESAGGQRMYHI
jgi:Rrf2 family protein